MSFSSRHTHWVLAAALLLGAAGAGYAASADGDIWWHLAAGREMVRTRALLHTDPFSIGALGRPWPDVHWLFQLVTYAIYRCVGLGGLIVAKCLVVAAGAMLLFAAKKRDRAEQVLFVTLFVGALFAARSLLLVRPVIGTLFFLAVFVFVLERFRAGARARGLLLLPLVQLVWVNCQGLSPLGPMVVAAYLAGDLAQRRRPETARDPASLLVRSPKALVGALAACLLFGFLTPFGVRAMTLPGALFARLVPSGDNVYASNIVENVPPLLLEQLNPGQFAFFPWFLVLLAVTAWLGASRVRLHQGVLVLMLVGLALLANRNVLLLYWMATPIVAEILSPVLVQAWQRWAGRRARPAGYVGGALAIAACLSLIVRSAWREPFLGETTLLRMPIESADWLSCHGEHGGKIFAADQHGGYLAWRLYPRFRPYMDTRLVLRTPEEFAEYLRVVDRPEQFDAFAERSGFDYVILPTGHPDRYLRLIAHLYKHADWRLVFTNGAEVLFERREPGPRETDSETESVDLAQSSVTESVLSHVAARWGNSPLTDAARAQLAMLDLAVGEFAQCERILAHHEAPEEQALRARCLLAKGDLANAAELASQLISRQPDDLRGLDVLAMVHASYGDRERAAVYLRRALSIDPFDAEANNLLVSMEVQSGKE